MLVLSKLISGIAASIRCGGNACLLWDEGRMTKDNKSVLSHVSHLMSHVSLTTFIFFFFTTKAETPKSIFNDTISLKEVVITDKPARRNINKHQFSNLNDFSGRRITNLLNEVSSVYLKNYGNGQLTTIAARGSSSSQTEVMWNGIRINSPMLGQSDLALLNVGFHNAISLQFNQLNSAIGCNLNLNNQPLDSGIHFIGSIRGGSFGLLETNMNMQYSNGKFGGATKVALLRATNNFPILKNETVQQQTHAEVLQLAAFQELHFHFKKNHRISAFGWWNKALREIPPTLHQPKNDAVQQDHSIRTMLQWNWKNQLWNLSFTTAWLNEKLRFQSNQLAVDDESKTHAVRNAFNAKFKWRRLTFETTAFADYERAQSAGYETAHQRGLAGISLRAAYHFKQGIFIQSGLREELMNKRFSPFMPYLSVGYGKWFHQHHLAVEATGKRSFRFPSMNDLYWRGSGNVNLLPESSWNTELSFAYRFGEWMNISVSNYYNVVSQQIQWTPDASGRWSPQNLKSVFARGIEGNAGFSVPENRLKNVLLRCNLSYAYTLATQTSSANVHDENVGKQLMYVPRNRIATSLNVGYKGFVLTPIFRYTGIRFINSDNTDFLPAYYVMDVELSKSFRINASSIKLAFRTNNLTNQRFEDIAQRAMPGRNFEGTVTFDLK